MEDIDLGFEHGAHESTPVWAVFGDLMSGLLGAFVIILDPIFQGLAVSLLFGVGASTVLTLIVIPVLYYLWIGERRSVSACPLPQVGDSTAPRHVVGNQPG